MFNPISNGNAISKLQFKNNFLSERASLWNLHKRWFKNDDKNDESKKHRLLTNNSH